MRLADLAGIDVEQEARDSFARLDPATPRDYRELAALLADAWRDAPPRRVGLSGGQGAGKTTLGGLIESACADAGLRACVLSLDDFYLPKADRRALADRVHPLFETRGPPGTHDMALCVESLAALCMSGEVSLPVFDKGLDDRVEERVVQGPFDVTILEGWCVGASAPASGETDGPMNALESERDADGTWRRAVDQALHDDYQSIWDSLDSLVYLRVPNLDAVRRWRAQQEETREPDRRMDSAAIKHFVDHFERITSRMMLELPDSADWLVELDPDHGVSGLSIRSTRPMHRTRPSSQRRAR